MQFTIVRLGCLMSLALAALLHNACAPARIADDDDSGDEDGEADGSADGSDEGAGGDGVLSVRDARYDMDANLAGSDVLFVVDLTLRNTSSAPTPLTFPFFSVTNDSDLVYPASALTVELDDACPSDARLDAGGTIECSIGFDIDKDEVLTKVSYDNGVGLSAHAAITEMPVYGVGDCTGVTAFEAPNSDIFLSGTFGYIEEDFEDSCLGDSVHVVNIDVSTAFDPTRMRWSGTGSGLYRFGYERSLDGMFIGTLCTEHEDFSYEIAVQYIEANQRSNVLCVRL